MQNRRNPIADNARKLASFLVSALVAVTVVECVSAADGNSGYTVVVSKETFGQDDWRRVVDALVARHDATVLTYENNVAEMLTDLTEQFPRYVCFVARSDEAGRQFVTDVHRMTRRFDDDPYTDCFWGILTGYDAANALSIAQTDEPLVVRRTASGTEVVLEMCEEGVWYCELEQHRMVRRVPGEEPTQERGPGDTTEALVDTLNEYHADLFVTSGHASERNWQIGFRYRNGQFRSEAGQLFGIDTAGERYDIDSPNPKVYLPIGNCSMGHINGPDAMALAWMNSAGVRQMIGYTAPTWYGYGGWGCLDYFVEQPGRYNFTESFFANHHALVNRMDTYFPGLADADALPREGAEPTDEGKAIGLSAGDARGLLFDRDAVAFYGDPAWEARMATADCAWDQTLTEENGVYTLEIIPRRGEETFEPINTNGSQRGWRPVIAYLPHRVQNVEVIEGGDLSPVVTDDFVLVPNPRECDSDRGYRVVFRAERVE